MDEGFEQIASGETGVVYRYRCAEVAHAHSHIEFNPSASITFTRGGGFTYESAGNGHLVHHGIVLMENPEIEYRIRHGEMTGEICTVVVFNGTWAEERADRFRTGNPDLVWSAPPGTGPRSLFPRVTVPVRPETALIHHLLERGSSTWDPSLESVGTDLLLIRLLDGIYDMFGDVDPDQVPRRNQTAELHRETIWLAKRYIVERFREDLTLGDIARAAGVSLYYFIRLFRSVTGSTPYRYLLDTRLAYSCLLLTETDRTSTEIAFDSGFGSISHFTTSFTRYAGVPPQTYRQQIRRGGRR